MAVCANCGVDLPEGGKFCGACGAKGEVAVLSPSRHSGIAGTISNRLAYVALGVLGVMAVITVCIAGWYFGWFFHPSSWISPAKTRSIHLDPKHLMTFAQMKAVL